MRTVLLKPRFKWTRLHSLYNELIKNPPENYKIETVKEIKKSNITKLRNSKYRNYLYKTLFYHLGELPYILSQLTQSSVNYEKYNVIFASQHVIKTEQPWVVDLEFANALNGYLTLSLSKHIVSKRLNSKSCKAILPWSNWAENTLRNSLDCKGFQDKIKVMRYTVTPKKFVTKKKDLTTKILFLGSGNPSNILSFEFKGLYETVDAFIDLQKKYDNLELIIRSTVPFEIKEKTKEYSNIKILDQRLSEIELENLYRSADIFPHAGFEVLNLSVLEAMSYGLPVIVTSLYSTTELIKNMKNGLLIDFPNPNLFYSKNGTPNDHSKSFENAMRKLRPYMTDRLKENMKLLIEDSSLRNKISREAALTIEKGEFSIENRNKLLKEIFDYATK